MGEVLHDSPDYVARARLLGPALAEAADEKQSSILAERAAVLGFIYGTRE
jgi:hypothetical protein